MGDTGTNGNWADRHGRPWLTVIISFGGLIVILSLAIVVLRSAPSENKLETAKYVFSSVLPLLASWIGTVLAYYFSRENFAAATQSVNALSQSLAQRLSSVSARDRMRPRSLITAKTLDPTEDASYKISDLLSHFKDVDRAVILGKTDILRFVIHKALIERFITGVSLGTIPAPANKTTPNITLADVIANDAQIKDFATNKVGFVAESATLADAKAKMDAIALCQDVFVTRTGAKDEPVLGWITDKKIAENSRLT